MQCRVCGLDNPPEARICISCGIALSIPAEPPPEIGVSSSYGHGWQQLWKHFLMLFLIVIITLLIGAPASVMSHGEFLKMIGQQLGGIVAVWAGCFSFVYGLFLVSPIKYGVAYAYLKAARNEPVEVRDMFEAFYNYWNAVLASLLVGVIIGIGMVLLIVPGIIFACKLAFTPYLVVDRHMSVIEAIKESWYMTDGHAGKVFCLGLMSIPIGLAGLICCVVGVIPAGMWISMAFASLYHAISSADDALLLQEEPVM